MNKQLRGLPFVLLHILMFLTMVNTAKAQNDSNYNEPTHSFKFSTQIGNNLIQNGRKQAKNQLYFRPSFMYYHISGFYLGTYITTIPGDKKNPLDNIRWNTGYDYDIGDHLTIGIDYSYSKYYTTKQVTSSAPHCVMLSASWYAKLITPSIYEIMNLGSTNDYTTNFDLSNVFIKKQFLKTTGKLSIPINIGTYYGTSNYYSTYAKKNKLTDKKGKPLPLNSVTTTSTQFTSFYASATIKYKISKFAISANLTITNQLVQNKYVTQTPVWRVLLSYYF